MKTLQILQVECHKLDEFGYHFRIEIGERQVNKSPLWVRPPINFRPKAGETTGKMVQKSHSQPPFGCKYWDELPNYLSTGAGFPNHQQYHLLIEEACHGDHPRVTRCPCVHCQAGGPLLQDFEALLSLSCPAHSSQLLLPSPGLLLHSACQVQIFSKEAPTDCATCAQAWARLCSGTANL